MHVTTIFSELFARPCSRQLDGASRQPAPLRMSDDGDEGQEEKESDDDGFDEDDDGGFIEEPGIAPDEFDDFDEEDFDDDFDDDFEEELEDDAIDDDIDDSEDGDSDDFDDGKMGLGKIVRIAGDDDPVDNSGDEEDETEG